MRIEFGPGRQQVSTMRPGQVFFDVFGKVMMMLEQSFERTDLKAAHTDRMVVDLRTGSIFAYSNTADVWVPDIILSIPTGLNK